MARLTDKQLAAITQWKGDGPITIGFREAVVNFARELLLARKRIAEATALLRELEQHHVSRNLQVGRPEQNSRTLTLARQALTALDAAKEKP